MTNPFESNDADYYVLTNDEGQHSLWPSFIEIPAGWNTVFGTDNRQNCLDYIESNWTDMRPNSLVKIMESAAG